ncbi:MAG: VWA domain-containing protein [Gemmatimonadetes bacterium]|nr:VWA domain-containing protein [Gemmatimonadota bacterium]
MKDRNLIVHIARFAGALRDGGIAVTIGDEIDATRALTLVDISQHQQVFQALRIALKISHTAWPLFDDLFTAWWLELRRADPPAIRRRSRRPAAKSYQVTHGMPGPRFVTPTDEGDTLQGDTPGYSAEALLRQRPFEECSPQDLLAMEKLLTRLVKRWATKKSRRLVPSVHRGVVDIRRSFRAALATDGEVLRLARRDRAIDHPRIVLLCDTSGSMDPYARFLLSLVLSLGRVARRAEVFVFNTSLTRLTPWMSTGKINLTLDRLAAGVPDWSGGTKIGECLQDFASDYATSAVDSRTVVVILSDGLDRGDPEKLEHAMAAIKTRAGKIIWLNPLKGDDRYQPLARGMAAALPYLDHFESAHNLASLERLIPLLTN